MSPEGEAAASCGRKPLDIKRLLHGHRQARETAEAAIAGNSASPPRVLEALARDKAREVWRKVVENPSTPINVLDAFAKGDNAARSNVAANPSTPTSLLEVLAIDEDPEIRASVAGNPPRR